jgi:transposase-like protein
MNVDLTSAIFNDEAAARKHLEALRWPDGPWCPHCGSLEGITKLGGKSTRPGVYKCKACRKPFSVTVGTVFERSHIALHKIVLANYLICTSKKGISAHQLHRSLKLTYKSAWFLAHRVREAMREFNPAPLGGPGKSVQADETYWGGPEKVDVFKTGKGWVKRPVKDQSGWYQKKEKILSLVEPKGAVRSYHVANVKAETLRPILVQEIDRASRLHTDEGRQYTGVGREFAAHETVNHSIEEYVRGDVTTNAVENYFSVLKRGLYGTYQHVSTKHLKRYLAEFDFRYNNRIRLGVNDMERAARALKGMEGKRIMYRRAA